MVLCVFRAIRWYVTMNVLFLSQSEAGMQETEGGFRTQLFTAMDNTDIDFAAFRADLDTEVERFTNAGSGWSVTAILRFRFAIDTPCTPTDTPVARKNFVLLRGIPTFVSRTSASRISRRIADVNRFDGRHRYILIVDDLMNEVNQNVCNIFTKLSHHRNVSVIFLIQNLFHRNKHVRIMSLNTHYIVLFKNLRDAGQVSTLARQMYPDKSKFVVEAFEDATKEPYGYLLIALKPETDDSYRIRTRIFPNDDRQYAYVSKV
jgi:hypothetical protein